MQKPKQQKVMGEKMAGEDRKWNEKKEALLLYAVIIPVMTVFLLSGCGRELEARDFPEVLVVSEAPLADALENAQQKSSKYLDYGQVKCVVLSQEIAEDEEMRRDVFGYMEGAPVFARNILFFAGDKSVLRAVEMQSDGLGNKLEGFYKNVPGRSDKDAVTLGNLLDWLHNGDTEVTIPLLQLRDGELVPDGGITLKANAVPAGNPASWKEG